MRLSARCGLHGVGCKPIGELSVARTHVFASAVTAVLMQQSEAPRDPGLCMVICAVCGLHLGVLVRAL